MPTETSDLRYPVGRFTYAGDDPEKRAGYIDVIAELPEKLRRAVQGMDDAKLDTPYRPGGWTVRQLVHHLPDSHMNSYIRFRLALTEDTPRIRPYDEARWAELPDARSAPVAPSFAILDGLHDRWTTLLRSMTDADFARKLEHPENGVMTLDRMVALYAWHSRHHVAHITELSRREGW